MLTIKTVKQCLILFLFMSSALLLAAGSLEGEVTLQPTNMTAILMFLLFVLATLEITLFLFLCWIKVSRRIMKKRSLFTSMFVRKQAWEQRLRLIIKTG